MATKAELEEEISKLKLELENAKSAETSAKDTAEAVDDRLHRLLSDHGIDTDAAHDIGANLMQELSDLQKEKPLVVLLGVFALGIIAGRALR